LIEAWPSRRLIEDRRIGERDVGRQRTLLIGRKADCPSATRCNAEPSVDERIEHEHKKFVHQLKRAVLGAGRGLAVELAQRVGERRSGQPEEIAQRRWQRRAAIDSTAQHAGEALLIGIKAIATELRFDGEENVGRRITKADCEVRVQAGSPCERRAAQACRVQNVVGAGFRVCGGDLDIAGERGGPGHIGAARARTHDIH
jgi:hypothetical protein